MKVNINKRCTFGLCIGARSHATEYQGGETQMENEYRCEKDYGHVGPHLILGKTQKQDIRVHSTRVD